MQPILFESQYLLVESLWLFVSIGFVLSSILLIKLAKRSSLRLNFILNHGFKILFVSIFFSRLIYITANYQFYFYDFSFASLKYFFYIWDKGLSFWGAIFGFLIALYYLCKKHDENINRWLDISVITFFLGLSIGSIGLFLDGAGYGHETDLPWGINFENITIRYSVPIHPTQLYAAFYNLALFFTSYLVYSKRLLKNHGDNFLASASAYALLKFLEEFLRGDESNVFLGLREAQYYAIIIGLITLFLLLDRYNKVDLSKIKKLFKRN